jgi:hypothetical protein
MNRRLFLLGGLAPLWAAGGCGPEMLSLKPAAVWSSHRIEYQAEGKGCREDAGTAGQDAEALRHPGQVVVGFDKLHGSRCPGVTRQLNHVYRGAVRFDLAGIPRGARFREARLQFIRGDHYARLGGEGGDPSSTGSCAAQLWLASADWWSGGLPEGALVPGTPLLDLPYLPVQDASVEQGGVAILHSKSFSLDVRPALEAWVVRGQANQGFVLVGGDESQAGGDESCTSWYGPFALHLVYDPVP